MYDHKKQEALNQYCLHNPQPGDYWEEMFFPVVVITEAEEMVTICEKTKSTDDHTWTWDLSQLIILTKAEFVSKLTYGSSTLKDKTWADAHPRHMMWAVEESMKE